MSANVPLGEEDLYNYGANNNKCNVKYGVLLGWMRNGWRKSLRRAEIVLQLKKARGLAPRKTI
jgi:hypothetical protein